MNKPEAKSRRIKMRHTGNGVVIEADRASYGLLMVAISEAIDATSDREHSADLRALRTALSQG